MEQSVKKVHIVYFSGTGSTAHAAGVLRQELEDNKVEVRISEIFQNNMPELSQGEVLVLMYPVYASDAPKPVFKWISGLKKENEGACYIVSVSGGGEVSPNTACRINASRKLKGKGFNTKGEYMICMPTNFIAETPENVIVDVIKILPQKCKIIAREIAENQLNHKKAFTKDRVLLPIFSVSKIGFKMVGKTLKASHECNGCGLCSKKCPTGNIKMSGNLPKFGWNCTLCMRCIYNCPQNAIHSNFPLIKGAILKNGYSMDSFIKLSEKENKQEGQSEIKGIAWQGVQAYLENVDEV